MMEWLRREVNELWHARFFSPRGFLARALCLALLFAGCELVGWREHTTFISGTAISADAETNLSITIGLVYMLAYFGFVLVAPVLVLAAGILWAWQSLVSSSSRTQTLKAPTEQHMSNT